MPDANRDQHATCKFAVGFSMDFDFIIAMLQREIDNKLLLARKHKARRLDIAEQRELAEVEHIKYAIRWFARKRREKKRLDAMNEVAL